MRRNKDFPSIERAEEILAAQCEALPEDIFVQLNGGVNLLPEARRDADGLYILGLYHNDIMGRYVELFYGSFRGVYPDADEETLALRLGETLRHELTHHLESLAGDRSLEKWDEGHRAMLLGGLYGEDASTARFAGGMYRRPEIATLRRRRPASPPEDKL